MAGGSEKAPKEGGGKEKSLAGFLKKRAPIYLGLTGLFLVFAVPSLTTPGLDDVLPELDGGDRDVFDRVMSYDGGDGSGITVRDAVDERVRDRFGDAAYGSVTAEASVSGETVALSFESGGERLAYEWAAGPGSIEGVTGPAKDAIDRVEFYD